MKKHIAFTALSAGITFSVLAGSFPVYANSNEINFAFETLNVRDEKHLVEVINKNFAEDLKDLKVKQKKEDSIVLESDLYKVTVDGIDIHTLGMQNGKISVDKKEKKENPFVQVIHNKLIQNEESKPKTKQVVMNVKDETAPTIEVEDEFTIDQNADFDLLSKVSATDDHDDNVEVEILDLIDTSKLGAQTINIRAKDASGNVSKKEVTVHVEENFYDKIAQAALAQLGVYQDCTMLVTNSLKAVGINFHSGPAGYLSLGEVTNDPVPGDIIVYSGHVAIYIGDGKAVHGGWLGNQTVVSTVECTNPFIAFVHVSK